MAEKVQVYSCIGLVLTFIPRLIYNTEIKHPSLAMAMIKFYHATLIKIGLRRSLKPLHPFHFCSHEYLKMKAVFKICILKNNTQNSSKLSDTRLRTDVTCYKLSHTNLTLRNGAMKGKFL